MKILAIDGNSIMNRAFYGIKMLSNKNGMFTNAITGFMNIYLKVTSDIAPEGVVCAFDMRAPTFRHKEVSSYKANRKGMPEELHMQMPYIKEILTALGVHVLETEGYEADDILGTVSAKAEENGDECYILTGDRDSLQLISDKVTVLLHTNKEIIRFTPEHFREEYGFEPIHLIDLKALMGDSSDNISGVKGIGEKTAMGLIQKYITVENLYEKLAEGDNVGTPSVVKKLEAGKADAEQSKWLATIVRNVPIISSSEETKLADRDNSKLSEILTELDMNKLMERLDVAPSENVTVSRDILAIEYTEGSYAADRDVIFGGLSSFLLEDDILKIVCGEKYYTVTDMAEQLKYFSCGGEKYTFSAKNIYRLCFENNTELKNITADGEILAYLLDAGSDEYSVEKSAARFGIPKYDEKVKYLPQLCGEMLKEAEKQGMTSLLYDIELPLTEVLASMEHYGVRVDTDGIREFGNGLLEDMESAEQQIYFMAGHEFNIASPKQLGTVLFEEMGLPAKKKTKTGYSTNAEVLEELRDRAPIVDLILTYRQLSKLNSTYVEGLLKAVSPDGRVHSVFRQTETRTGRISSTEPNMQNIPVRTELGRNMRKFFISADNYVLLDADYSQIELRILAHMSGDENMRKAFLDGMDIHTATAAQVFNMPAEMVTPEMRRAAKAVNFGIVYGIGAFSLSKDIGVSVKKADDYINNYLKTYSGVDRFMKKTVEDAVNTGYAETMYGRKRYIPELKASNKNVQAFGKRAAMNAPIQGTAADIIKIAMVRVYKRLKEEGLDARLILQVHDELIIEASEKDKDRAAVILNEEMMGAAKLTVPLPADVAEGRSWFDAKL
ncbi:MAG: DNA polymerase I [Oscillospiraceae bacterium]|nr:DNA polymerase I [Oscillospiraceae bacterium]